MVESKVMLEESKVCRKGNFVCENNAIWSVHYDFMRENQNLEKKFVGHFVFISRCHLCRRPTGFPCLLLGSITLLCFWSRYLCMMATCRTLAHSCYNVSTNHFIVKSLQCLFNSISSTTQRSSHAETFCFLVIILAPSE